MSTRKRILDVAVPQLLAKGFEATRVEDICKQAGVAKGGFFHHFKTKEDLAIAAAAHFADRADEMFEAATYHDRPSARDRLRAYVDLRREMMQGELADFTCLFGMLAQETFTTHPKITTVCGSHIEAHAHTLVADIAEATEDGAEKRDWEPESLALFMQAVVQGAFVLSKARGDSRVAAGCFDHLKRYLALLIPEQVEELTVPGEPPLLDANAGPNIT